jgi:hypothetical protein
MGEEFYGLVKGKNLIVYPDSDIRTQVLNATGVETPRGFRMAKEKASRKIDLAVALAMACCAALQAGKPMATRGVPIGVGKVINPFARWPSPPIEMPRQGSRPIPIGVGNTGFSLGRSYGSSGGRYQSDDDD